MTLGRLASSLRSSVYIFRQTTLTAFTLVGLIALQMSSPALAQEKTPANAFEFIRATMTDASWTGWYLFCDQEYYFDGILIEGECSVDEAPISSVYYSENSYCAITFQMSASGSPTRTVDLRKQFELTNTYKWIFFAGPVVMTNGEVTTDWIAYTSNSDAQARVFAALQYLRDVCKPNTGPW